MFNIILNGFHCLTIWLLLETSLRWGDKKAKSILFPRNHFLISFENAEIFWVTTRSLVQLHLNKFYHFCHLLVSFWVFIYGVGKICFVDSKLLIAKKTSYSLKYLANWKKNKRHNPYVTDIVINWQIFKPVLVLQFLHWLSLWHWTKNYSFSQWSV